VLSSVSGGGKNTVLQKLIGHYPDKLCVAVTATSRAPRTGEKDGVHYHFLQRQKFLSMIDESGFIEHAEVHGNLYGIPKTEIENARASGKTLLLNIDVQGMATLKEKFEGQVLTIFLLPPDEKTWEHRLRSRGTESDEDIALRLRLGKEELARASQFDYQVVNDDLNRCIKDLEEILRNLRIL